MARPTVSQVLYEQMIGRGLRGRRFGGTDHCVIVDLEDAVPVAEKHTARDALRHWRWPPESRICVRIHALESDQQISAWHAQASELLQGLEEAGIDNDLRLELQKEMSKAGWNADSPRARAWPRTNGGTYAVPIAYHGLLTRIAISLRSRMQEYLLGEMRSTGDEPIPPQYRDFVDRYYKVIAGEGKISAPSANMPSPQNK